MSALQNLDRNMPILVVDDFSTMRRIIKNCLHAIGFTNITEAGDGQHALAKIESTEFKFIISDWNMPNMMGIDLLKAVRADPRLETTPFLMVTGESQKDVVMEATQSNVDQYIVKPFTADILQIKMESLFSKTASR